MHVMVKKGKTRKWKHHILLSFRLIYKAGYALRHADKVLWFSWDINTKAVVRYQNLTLSILYKSVSNERKVDIANVYEKT